MSPRHRRLIPPLAYAAAPQIDLRYWVAISLASVFGCNLGDFVSLYLHLGHWLGLVPLATLFAALIAGARRSGLGEGWYWAIVIVLRTAATNLADLATHTFNLPYPWVIASLEMVQVLIILPVLPRLPAPDSCGPGRPAVEGWYWAALLTAGTLGTALGDGVAEDLHLGTGWGTLALGAITLVVIALGARSRWSTKAAYWLTVVAIRAAGTTAGDWLAFGDKGGVVNGLHLGLPLSTAGAGAAFVLTLALWRPSDPASSPAPDRPDQPG